MTDRKALLLSIALIAPVAAACSGSSGGPSTSSGSSTGTSGGTTGVSIEPVTPPKFSPPTETANNDLAVVATADQGATVCYLLDGGKPTCDLATAACTGAQTYSGATQIAITGAVTDPTSGQATIEAIACTPGNPPSAPTAATYTLQAAAPTMSSPTGNSTLAYDGAKPFDPLISTATNSSTSNVQIWYTVGAPPAAAPTCGTGDGPIPASGSASSGLVSTSFTSSTTFQAIACKPGYLPSAVTQISYSVQLNPPSISAINPNEDGGVWPAATTSFDYDVGFAVDDTANAGASDYLCVVTGTAPAACDPSGACDAGMMLTPGGEVAGPVHIENASSFSASVSGVACGGTGLTASAVTTVGPYELLLDPVTSNPTTGLTIPESGALQLTLEQSGLNPEDPATATALPYDYICWSEDVTTTPSCSGDCPQSMNGVIDGVLQGEQHANGTSVALPASGFGSLDKTNFAAGITIVAVGCLNSTPPPAVVFGPAPLADVVIAPAQ